MKPARRFPQRLVRWTSLCVCFALVLTSFLLFPSQASIGKNARNGKPSANSGAQGNGQERRTAAPTPQTGPPRAGLPDLDDLRRAAEDSRRHGPRETHAPAPIPSTQRRLRHGQRAAIGSKSPGVRANHVLGTIAAPQGTSDMAMARIDPHNRTGSGGVDLLSNNFNWSLGLVGLKGRGGLDLGLTLSYNSLATWTQSGIYIDFDQDQGTPSPGFRLGFPVVQGPYYNNPAGTNFYLLITPSGQHVELRQLGTSNVYQAVDASYSQLTVYNSGSYLIFRAGGAELTFSPMSSEYHCTQVKDRNGNYLSVTYKPWGDIYTITDTLGRVITFVYDTYANLKEIDQTWSGTTHQWATFGWGTASIGNNFPTMIYAGPLPGTSIQVLTQVGLPDGSHYNFEYNNSYGQVSTIRYSGGDNRPLNYTTYDLPASSTDCPRVSAARVWADWWNGMNGVPAEIVTSFAHDGNWCLMTSPDGTIYKEFYGSGWQSGLTTQSEVWSGGGRKKWTTTAWTQENPSVSYPLNPRVTETNINDAEGNLRRTTISYGPYAAYSLPYGILDYAADGVTPLRSKYIDYNLSADYVNRRIIGLVSAIYEVDHTIGSYVSKTTFDYDWGNEYLTGTPQPAMQHDDTNYGAAFVTGRGTLCSVWRWDVTDIVNPAKAIPLQRTGYDSAGSVVFTRDALNHQTTINYAASFSDGTNRNTFAYPTTATDEDNNSSAVQYNFDFGAVTRTEGPPPAGQSQGAIQTMTYDGAGRI